MSLFKSFIISDIFDYSFKNAHYLFQAFTHKSFAHEVKIAVENNEKLEFLGDSVLQMVVSEQLYLLFPQGTEGELSKLRSSIVNEVTLASLGRHFHLSHFILLGKGEFKGQGYNKDSIIADTLEAILGAIYLDSNFETTKTVLLNLFATYEKDNKTKIFDYSMMKSFDAKSKLQELVMEKYKTTPKYVAQILNENEFEISLFINERCIDSIQHKSKKKAMQLLAKKVLENQNIFEENKGKTC